jgi:uncharacterized protein YbaP (TraB family)
MERFKRFEKFGFKRFVAYAIVAVLALLAAPLAAAQKNFLWKVAGRQNVVYLAGSVHMLTSDYYPLSAEFEGAYKDSNLLVEEVDLNEMLAPDAQFSLLTRGMLPANQSLDTVLSASTFAAVNRLLGGLGVPIEPLKRFKPWMLSTAIEALELQQAGFNPELGLDKHFYDEAQADGKMVQGLETVEFQISRFDGMSLEQQDRMLANTLKELSTEKASVNKLAQAWKAGDAATVESIVLADLKSDPVMYQRLLVERNRAWLPKVEGYLSRHGHTFVVVGAAHLVGPDGLVAMLRARGYQVEQM